MSIRRPQASLNPCPGDAILKISVPVRPGPALYWFEVAELSSKDAEKASNLPEKLLPIGGVPSAPILV